MLQKHGSSKTHHKLRDRLYCRHHRHWSEALGTLILMKSSALAAQLPAAAVHTLMIMLATSQHDTHAASPRAAPAAPPRPAAPPQVNTSFGVVTGKARLAFSASYKPILHAKPRSHCRAALRLPLPPSHCNATTADRTATSHCLF